jgi:hypothetical protein
MKNFKGLYDFPYRTCLHNDKSSTNKTDRRDITEILLKVALNAISLNPTQRNDKNTNLHRLS